MKLSLSHELKWEPTHKLEKKYSPYSCIHVVAEYHSFGKISVTIIQYDKDNEKILATCTIVNGFRVGKIARRAMATEEAKVNDLMVMLKWLDQDNEIYWRTMGAS